MRVTILSPKELVTDICRLDEEKKRSRENKEKRKQFSAGFCHLPPAEVQD